MTTFVEAITAIVTGLVSWVSSAVSMVTSNPLILFCFLFAFAFAAIGAVKRLAHLRRG